LASLAEVPVTGPEFQEALLAVLDRKDHRAWRIWTGPGVAAAQLRGSFEQEWLVFVRDFPRYLGRVHGNCPDPAVRRALAANLYEEETGGLSGTRPHPELFLDQMEALGFPRGGFDATRMLPEALAYRAFLDRMTEGPWVRAAAITTLWLEGSVHERRVLAGFEENLEEKLRTHYLVVHHGLRPEQLTLPRAHAAVEGGHRRDAWAMVLGHAREDEARRDILDAMETACALWHLFRDAVTRRAGLRID
jgi:pyrroloquinoline quinone (PQQ) biosynthesis protein C